MAVRHFPGRVSAEEYHRMADEGILGPDDRVELIDGEIIEKMTIGPHHAAVVRRLTELLFRIAGDAAIVSPQNPLRTNDFSEPEPDLALLRRKDDFYESGHPKPDDTLLAIEVSDSRVGYDRTLKIPHYAANGIVEAWLVDLPAETVEVHREPTPAGYAEVQVVRRGAAITLVSLPSVTVNVTDILGGSD